MELVQKVKVQKLDESWEIVINSRMKKKHQSWGKD